ncbi:MAG: hypothetical protein RL134_408 [Actinomycetota bacterium]
MHAVVVAVAGALALAACTSGTSTSGTSSSDAAPASSPAPVESAGEGEVAGEQHPKSKCRSRDDVTANARIYNNLDVVWLRNDFRARTDVDPSNTDVVWLMQTGEKAWNFDDEEGEWECARPPMGVSNLQTYYYWDGKVWSDHPGWWGHQEDRDWARDPNGYVWWKCTNVDRSQDGSVSTFTKDRGCIDSALASAEIKAPWDTRDNDTKDVKTYPSCEVRNSSVVGCWTDTYNSGYKWDFVYDTYAWTAPMRVDIKTTWTGVVGKDATVKVYKQDPAKNPGGDFKNEKLFLAWRIVDASLTQGAQWAQRKSPVGQVVGPGDGNVITVGAYALARNAKTTLQLKLEPINITSSTGEVYACRKGATSAENACWPDASLTFTTRMPAASREFLDKNVTLRIAASLELDGVRGNGGRPSIKKVNENGKQVEQALISCQSDASSLAQSQLSIECASTGGSAGSSYAFGASWLATITNK